MNYLEQTTIVNQNNTEYKCVRLQQYNNTSHKATNKYYINGKIVHSQARFVCESTIDESSTDEQTFTEKRWTK